MSLNLIAGPYTGEMAFEFLTWLPYLRARYGESLEQLIVISRGGTKSLYPCTVINAHDVMSAAEIRDGMMRRRERTGKYKQTPDDPLDNEILRRLGFQSDIHPCRATALPWQRDYIRKLGPAPRMLGLPDKYVAARLYQNDWLDKCPPPEVIKEHAGGLPIVWVMTAEDTDNHAQFVPNVEVQQYWIHTYISIDSTIKIFSNAEKVLAPAGGMAYLAQLCGTEAVSFSNQGDEVVYNRKFDEKLVEFAPNTRVKF